ncbi:protein hu-li tai shao isoform X3 [Plodia interpunctella]|uniref:protein hu-li tai shao isoform X3 n=1 Tax=Plodia interpunctella TaxID=58824 RepID=UPI0023680DCB|nr:protein hu-li tai shao isoform X3 [Plodia interpunctella]
MADTDTETLPNGTGPLSSEEEERLKQRPADIDADVREMERRKRVEALMSSKLFREELERVLDQQMHEGNDAPLLQRIREMVGGRLHTGSLRGPSCVLPINDIRGIEGVGYEKGEKILRCKLAAVYRLVDLFGWSQTGISGQITARLNTAVEQVLTTPRGLLPHEVTASSLVKVDMQGVVQDQGTTNFPVNVEGFSLHASVHAARPDVRCVLHVRSPGALAVSSTRRGLLPLCHEAALLGELAYLNNVSGGVLDNEERDQLVRQVGPHAKVLFLSSQGALCCGATLEEAFHQARNLTAACEVQHRLAALPLDELILIDAETKHKIYEASRKPPSDCNKWRVGGEEFEALMRMLDNAGFRTGYIYRNPLIKNDVPRPKNDVEVPPAVSSLGYLLEEEELYKQGLWKKGGKTGERTRWLNSPNVYQKVEVLETGTSDPKKITKWVDANNEEWVQDGSPAHSSTPVKIDTLQFVPKNTNPKEFKALQQQIKDNRRADKISAGPQSHILEGVTWDEASKLVGEDAVNTHTGDHVVLMGAASKGIIQRGYQHNATVYSAPYARNPFDQISDRELDEYRRTVERKQRGNEYDTDLSESEAISAAQITSPASAPSETEEESRDEHRVLRIETKQVPIRSQPEVVLSDDTNRDPNLLSDDEAFLRSAPTDVSRVTSPMSLTVPRFGRASDQEQSLLSDDEVFVDARRADAIRAVVVRAQTTAVQRSVVRGEHTVNGDHSDAHQSTFSHSSKEGSPSKEVSTEDSPKKDKKKKKGLRTPSFLKKKKEKKKEKSSTPQPA